MRTSTASILVFLLYGMITPACYAQQDSVALSEEYYKLGMEIFDFTHRKQATELFVLSTQMNPKNARAQFMAGKSIMLTIRKEQSLDYFKRAWRLDPKIDEDILYYLGQAYHYSEKFDSAINFYDRYNRFLSRSLRFERAVRINEVNRKIFECRNAMIYVAYPMDVTISHLDKNINSEYPDYAPCITADEQTIIFTTRDRMTTSMKRLPLIMSTMRKSIIPPNRMANGCPPGTWGHLSTTTITTPTWHFHLTERKCCYTMIPMAGIY